MLHWGTSALNKVAEPIIFRMKWAWEALERRWFLSFEFKEYVWSPQDEAEEGHLRPKEWQIQRTEACHSRISATSGYCTWQEGKIPLGDNKPHAAGCLPSLTPAAIHWQQLPSIMITNGMLPHVSKYTKEWGCATAHKREDHEHKKTDVWQQGLGGW